MVIWKCEILIVIVLTIPQIETHDIVEKSTIHFHNSWNELSEEIVEK